MSTSRASTSKVAPASLPGKVNKKEDDEEEPESCLAQYVVEKKIGKVNFWK
jgi:hypothetical protein